MYHSVTFGDKNSWTDWKLVPTSRPVIAAPPVREILVDIPGMNGQLDLTEGLTGEPLYDNREGSLEFVVVDRKTKWHEKYTEIANYLHGKKLKLYLEDDKDYYYIGRFKVNEWKSEELFSKIVIDYSLEPFKISRRNGSKSL